MVTCLYQPSLFRLGIWKCPPVSIGDRNWSKLCILLFRYYVEFSKPDKIRPIPEGTVKVYFDITVGEGEGEFDIEFNFENESLKHRIDSTMREAKF